MRELDKVAENLFDKIRTRFENVNLGDEKSKRTSNPEKARFFNFDYVSKIGKNYGNVTVSIVDGDGIKVFFSKNITDELENAEQDEWFNFLRGMRQFAKQNFMSFDARDINKSGLDLRDIKQQANADAKFTGNDVSGASSIATESRMYGTRNMSFQECGPVKIRIKHSSVVDEESRGSRSRNIEAIYLDNHLGERRLLPFTSLHGARAMATHCSQGGTLEDDIGQSIGGMVTEMGAMRSFVREAKRRQFEDVETSHMATAAVQRYGELQRNLKNMAHHKGYESYKSTFEEQPDIEEDIDVDALRDRFVKKVYNEKFTEALPYVYRAYKKQQESIHTEMGEQFEDWASNVTEDAFETDDEKVDALKEIMAAPLQVGRDGMDAYQALRTIFSDESLDDRLTQLAGAEGPDVDARQTVLDWMREQGMCYIADDIEETLAQAEANPAPEPEAEPDDQSPQEPAAPEEPQIPTESTDPLQLMRYLAGMRKR